MHYSKKIIVALLGLSVGVSALSKDDDETFTQFKNKEEGWMWKKDPKEKKLPPPPEPKPEQPKPEQPKQPEPEPIKEPEKKVEEKQPFSTKWLSENLPKLLEKAMDEPTEENLAAYFYAQRMAFDKSQVFAEKSRAFVASDPLLDETSRVPMASFARMDNMKGATEAKERAISRLSTIGGLWMFYRSDCKYCEPMADAILGFKNKHNFNALFISMDKKPLKILKEWVNDEGQAKKLGVKIAPTVMFVVPPSNYFIVSQGAMSMSELMDRILLAAESNKLLTEREIREIYPDRRGVLGTESMQDGATTDPKELVKRIRERLNQTYTY